MSRPVRPRKKEVSSTPNHTAESAQRVGLFRHCLIESIRRPHETLHRPVIGQDGVIDRIVCAYSRILSGVRDPGRPLSTMLLLGPTGVGNTETAKASPEPWSAPLGILEDRTLTLGDSRTTGTIPASGRGPSGG